MVNKPVFLVVSPWKDPLVHRDGGSVRTRNIIFTFNKFAEVIVVFAPHVSEERVAGNIKKVTFWSYHGRGGLLLDVNIDYYMKLFVFVRKFVRHSVYIVISGPLGIFGASFVKWILSRRRNIFLLYDAHNVERERLMQSSIVKSKFSAPLFVTKLIFLASEFLATKVSDYILSVSWEDKLKFMELYRVPPERIVVVPSDISSAPLADKLTTPKLRKKFGRPVCVFHGTYNYLPNKEAVDTIIREIAPKVSEAYFFIAGKGIPKDMPDVPENVQLVGFVDDLEEFLASCDIAVVPLKRGAGTKLKMYDYMRVGLAIVTTKKGAEGLGLVNGKHAIVIDEVNSKFIMEIQKLVAEPKKRIKLGHNVRKLLDIKRKRIREFLFRRNGDDIHGKI